MRYLLAFLLLPFTLTLLPAQRGAKVPDPDPELERKSFKVADGFEVNLFAADPLLHKPIQMNFDSAGRLWVVSSETYPQIKPGQKANDKIIVLEDTKGAGKADKVSVFADGLLIPSGLEPGDGGVYVANSTDLVHLGDPRGTGKATQRRVVLSGFGTEDTHHMLHTLRWGHDGNLYMNQSIYIHSHIETPHGPRRLNGGGIWRFRPDTLRLDVFMRGLVNGWGHHFDRFGQSFATDGAGGEGVNVVVPYASYVATPGAARILRGLNPGSPKYCGLEIVSGRHLPDDWQGNLITCDFRAHRVCRFVLAANGAGFTARLMPDVIRASHPAFRPVDVKMGPDGAIYVADWYNPIIQHGEVDFRDPRRDQTRGRIWRITAKGRQPLPRPDLKKATPAELCKYLEAPEGWTRHFARRELKERGVKAALPALRTWAKSLDQEPHLLEALWTYQTLDVVEVGLLRRLLEARDGRVRAAAVRVLAAWKDRVQGVLPLVAARVDDDEPLVRREAVTALGEVPAVRSAELALRALGRPVDTYLDYALWLTMRELEPRWLPALQAGRFDYGGHVGRLTFALRAVGSDKVVRPLAELVRGGKLSGEAEDGVLALLAGVGRPAELGLVLDRALKLPAARQGRLLAALEESATQRGTRPAGDLKRLTGLLGAADEGTAAAAARLLGLWGVAEARPKLAALAGDARANADLRRAAVDGLASLGGPASRTALAQLADDAAPAVRRRALVALASVDLQGAAARAAVALAAAKSADGADEVFAAFLQRRGGAALLAQALAGKKLPQDVARVGVRAVRTSGREAPGLAEALAKAGSLTFGARTLTPQELRQLVAEVADKGDPERGEKVYRRADLLCLKCHAVGGAGGQVGPDLSSIGASAQVDYLIESLLLPSKAIKENYHAVLVTTTRGRQLTGIKVRQTPTALILRDDQDREVAVGLKDIEEQTASKSSLMPEGLTDTLTRGELIDLVRFLTSLGKAERWSVGKERLARRWQVLQPNKEVYRLINRNGMVALAADPPGLLWEPAYGTVAGNLPLTDLPRFRVGRDGPMFTLLRAQLDAAAASQVRLKVSGTRGLTAWLDGEPLTLTEATALALKPGVHTLTLAVNHAERTAGLRLEVEDTPAAAAVRFVGGK